MVTCKIVRTLVVFVTAHILIFVTLPGAHAQHGQGNEYVPLKSNIVSGALEATGKSDYYSFTAGPGNVSVDVSCSTDYYSSKVEVTLTDIHEHQLADVQITADPGGTKRTAVVHLDRKQTVRMSVLFGTNPGVHVQYDVRLSGAFSLNEEQSQLADARVGADYGAKASEAPSAPVAPSAPGASEVKSIASIESTVSDSDSKSINGPIEDKWALVVGISKYQNESINLKYPAKDAQDLHNYLIKEANFAPDHVKLLVDEQATKEHVLEEIGDKWLPRLARPNDLVLIFISCHGSPSQLDLEGLNYLVMYDTKPDSLYATGLPLQDLATVIRQRVHSDRVVVIVDACHSGAANTSKGISRTGNIDSSALSQGTGQLVICSSKPDQVSWESKRYPNGVFTHQLIEALRTNSGRSKLGSVFAQLKESVLAEVLSDRKELQTPVLKSKWSGDELMLAAPPSKPRRATTE